MFRAPQHIAVVDPLGWITCLSFWKSGTWKNIFEDKKLSTCVNPTNSVKLFLASCRFILKGQTIFSLRLSTTYKTFIEFVTCKNNYVRYNGVQHNIQCDCWMQKEISVAPKTLKNGSKPPINGVQPEQTSIFRISSMKWKNTFSLKVFFSI